MDAIEKTVSDLKKIFTFKDSTREGDVVLIVAEQILYAVVTGISRDFTRKDEWWHLDMQLLTLPPQKITWILREPQFTGQEIFTMGGAKRFISAIDFGEAGSTEPFPEPGPKKTTQRPILRVIK